MLLFDIFTPSSVFWPPLIFTFISKSENYDVKWCQKIDEGVKISKSNIWPLLLVMEINLHRKGLSENLKYLPLSFYRQLKFPYIHILVVVLYKTRKPHSINTNRFLAKFLTFKHRNQVNRFKNENFAMGSLEGVQLLIFFFNSLGFCIIIESLFVHTYT